MNGNRVFRGNIKVCNYMEFNGGSAARMWPDPESGVWATRPDDIVKENAILIKVANGLFIDVDKVKGNLDAIRKVLRNDALRTQPRGCGWWYVDEESLIPYYSSQNERTSIYQLRKVRNTQANIPLK